MIRNSSGSTVSNIVWAVAVVLIAGMLIGAYVSTRNNQNEENITPTPTPEPTTDVSRTCTPDDLEASLVLEGAAGSTEGTLTVTNTSSTDCRTGPELSVDVLYPNAVQNLTINQTRTQETFTLKPEEALVSDIRYPNGAQCTSPVKTDGLVNPQLDGSTISYADQTQSEISITVCIDESEETTLTISAFSSSN